jgi:recombinational DNA repair ATPase RecF
VGIQGVKMKKSIGEKIVSNFPAYLKQLEKEKQCFFLPFEVSNITFANIGPHKIVDMDFFNDINVIEGPNGSGKTIILQAIAHQLSPDNIIRKGATESQIKLELAIKKDNRPSRCILIDDAGDILDDVQYEKFIDYLRSLKVQVIITSHRIRNIMQTVNFIDIQLHKGWQESKQRLIL